MRKAQKKGWKRICSVILAAVMVVTMFPAYAQAGTSSDNGDGTFDNPAVYSDVPDIDMIRVGETYYMVSTTMHLSPGCPIMKSTDLVNWEIVNYVYDILGDTDAMNLRNGKNMYGNGQWASSLQYHNGTYYVAFNSNTTGTAYIFATDDIEHGSWKKTTLNGSFHDMALFFDDNGKAYIVYGGTQIRCVELSDDLSSAKKETETILFDINAAGEEVNASGNGFILPCEGSHIMKKDGYYYVFNISWPNGAGRTEICHRSKTFPSTQWENKVILQADFRNNGVSGGVAQGGVIDTKDGKWYGFLFQDHGAVGRVPVLTDCTWKDGWPMLGKNGDGKTVEAKMQLPASGSDIKTLVKSDEFYNDAEHREFAAEETQTAGIPGEAERAAVEAAHTEAALSADESQVQAMPLADEPQTETVELIKNGNFEDGAKYWQGFERGEIEAVADGEAGNHVLKVTARKNTSSSAMFDLSGQLEKGRTYRVSGKIKYMTGPDTKNFNLMCQNGKDYQYRQTIGSVEAVKGQWTEFSLDYIPGDKGEFAFSTTQNQFFIETPWVNNDTLASDPDSHLMDYYLDDISITYEKPVESGDNPGGADDSQIQLFTNGDVETGTADGWTTTPGEKCTIAATDAEKANGTYSLHVTERAGTGAGACQDVSGKLVKGKTYTISGKLKYTTGPETKRFFVTIQNGPDYNYRVNAVTINAVKGEWVEFKGSYTPSDKSEQFPFDPERNFVFVENPWTAEQSPENDRMEYYLDDFSMTVPSDNMISDGSFKNGVGAWESFGKVEKLEVSPEGRDDSSSLKVSGRTADWQGASMDFTNKLTQGNTYTFTAYVKYDFADKAEQNFNLTMKGGEGASTKYLTMATAAVKAGEWTKLTGEWIMPDDASDIQVLYFNSPGGTMDFYIDDVSMVEKVNDKEPVQAGEHDYNGSDLDLAWQWNHNPNNNNWSLTDRSGWLRLTTGSKTTSILKARNTLTQRTYGPACSGRIKMDISNMKSGDVAGLASFSYNYGYIAVTKEGNQAKLVMVDASGNSAAKEDQPVEKASADCTGNIVYLKEDFNFAGNADGSAKDTVTFYYSFDGANWTQLGEAVKLSYELTHFMGSRFAIFNYATKTLGGYVDYDYFRVADQITGASQPVAQVKAELAATPEVSGVIGSQCEVKLNLDELAAGNHSSLKASVSIPDEFTVEDVIFNTAAIKGEASYTYKNNRLLLTVKGGSVSFKADDKLFATIKLAMEGYADADKTVEVKADYVMVDDGALEYNVDQCSAPIKLKYLDTKALAKKLGYGNPIMTQAFGADPYAMEYDGRVYVYMTADAYQYDENGNLLDNDFSYIDTLRVVSSADLMNWTDHGEIAVAGENGAAKWAKNSWAPAIAHKKIDGKEKFFLYFANGGSGIGVLEGDSPLGPWRDPNGKALLSYGYPECQGVVWCFDPAVLVDDDGTGYIYFGGGVPEGQNLNPKTARVAKLTDDMVHIENRESKMIDAPCMFEDSGIFKYDGKYYYSYCSNFTPANKDGYPGTGTICYMVSDDPMGPFTYAGEIFSNPSVWFGTGGNNHHATFVFEGKSYFIYHAQTVSKVEGKDKGYRSTHIDNIDMNKDGTIRPIKGTYAGISQLHKLNPYDRIDAETIAWNAGVKVAPCAEPGKLFTDYNTALTDLQDGDWTSVSQADFGQKGAGTFQVYAASAKGGSMEVRLDSPEGTLIGTVQVPATGSDDTYKLVTCDVDNVTGVENVFLVFRGSKTENIMNVDYYQFTEKKDTPVDPKPEKPTAEQIQKMNDKIAEAEKLLEKLDEENKAKLQTEINEAKALLSKEDATKETMEAGIQKLTKAVEEAEKTIKPVDPKPEKPVLNEKFTDDSGLKYKVTACSGKINTVMVIGASQQFTNVTIPDTRTFKDVTFKVTAVGSKALANQKSLKSAVIGKYVTSIGAKAFCNDKKLTKVTFKGTAVKSVAKDAFKNISKKAVFSMKKGFTVKGLKYMITECTVSKKSVKVTGVSGQPSTVKIPDTVKFNGMTFQVTAIRMRTFKNQKNLKSVVIGKYVNFVGREAFCGAKKLAKIKFAGTAVKTIRIHAFKGVKKNAVFFVKKAKNTAYQKLLKRAKTKNYKVKTF